MSDLEDRIALVDLDGTVADYDGSMLRYQRWLQAPSEEPYKGRYGEGQEPPHVERRRKFIQRLPGFWRDLDVLPLGMEVVHLLRAQNFEIHVLTKGPRSTPNAWSEKVEWCTRNFPDAIVTVTGDKSLVYGRVLFDDYPPYFEAWLAKRPRGLVVCLAHPWNEGYVKGGPKEHPQVLRYDGSNSEELRERLARAHGRKGGEAG